MSYTGVEDDEAMTGTLAIDDGPATVSTEDDEIFSWPIITDEDEEAIGVLRRGVMSDTDVSPFRDSNGIGRKSSNSTRVLSARSRKTTKPSCDRDILPGINAGRTGRSRADGARTQGFPVCRWDIYGMIPSRRPVLTV